MTKGEIAKNNFLNGYNCTQSIAVAFADEMGLEPDMAAKIASGFGGGFGRMREVCGAVSGMVMVLSMIKGYSDPKSKDGKIELYRQVQEVMNRYKEKNGSYICKELLGIAKKEDTYVPEERTAEYYKKRPCGDLIAMAADILQAELENN